MIRKDVKILICDDDLMLQEGLKMAMQEELITCDVADDGREALESMLENEYKLIILDIQMPHENGLEVLKKAQTIKNFDTPVIILSGTITPEFIDRANEMDVYKILKKPVNPFDLALFSLQVISNHHRHLSIDDSFLRVV